MILFYQDWKKHPGSRPDFSTKNTSFVDLASVYKAMGVKNHCFHLALIDQSLKGLNPHDPNLPLEVLERMAVESQRNPWYWIREVFRVPGSSGGDAEYLTANRGFISAWWLFFNHVTYMLTQPRQTGKSLQSNAMIVYLSQMGNKNTPMAGLTRSEYLRAKTIEDIKDISDSLPPTLNFSAKDDAKNNFSYTIKARGNKYRMYLPSASESKADALGRGFTVSVFTDDEGPFQPNSHITTPVMLSTTVAAREKAAKAGANYGVIITTTGGNRRTKEGEYFYNMQAAGAIWSEAFFDTQDLEELEKVIRANSRAKTLSGEGTYFVTASFDHRQLGKTDQWLINAAEITGSKGELLLMDYFGEWVAGSSMHPLSAALQKRIEKSELPIVYTDIDKTYGYIINWYIPKADIKKRLQNCVAGMDTSNASGGDYISLVFTDVTTGETLGSGSYNCTSINMWSEWLFGILAKYPKLVLVPENKSSAMAIIDTLFDLLVEVGINPFVRIFNTVVHKQKEYPRRYEELIACAKVPAQLRSFYYRNKSHMGYVTAGSGEMSRNILYGNLEDAVERIGHVVYDKRLKNQLLGLVRKNGRIDHQAGEHDDLVIGWLLNYWFLTTAVGTSYYGLNSLSSLINIPSNIAEVSDPVKVAEHLRNDELRSLITTLKKKFADTTTPAMKIAIRRKIYALANAITDETDEAFNADQLLANLKDKKQRAKNANIVADNMFF